MKNKIRIGLSILFIVSSFLSLAQPFDYYYRSLDDDWFWDAGEDSQGNIFLLTYQGDPNGNYYKSILIKLDKNGQVIDKLELCSFQDSSLYTTIIIDQNDNVIIAGFVNHPTLMQKRIEFKKLDNNLAQIWSKPFGNFSKGLGIEKLKISSDKSYLYFIGSTLKNQDVTPFVGKIDMNGDSLFQKSYNFPGKTIYLYDVLLDKNRGYILAEGVPYSPTVFGTQLIGLDSLFEIDTVVSLNGIADNIDGMASYSNRASFVLINDTTFMIAGRVRNKVSAGSTIDFFDFGIQMRNRNYTEDTTIIKHTFDIREHPGISNISIKGSNIFGAILSNFDKNATVISSSVSKFYLARLNAYGSIEDEHYYSNNGYLSFYGILATNDGGTLIYGASYLDGYNGSQERDAYVLKVDSSGNSNITPAGLESENINSAGVKIYPNPVNDELHVFIDNFTISELIEIRVSDFLGRTVYQNQITSNPFSFSTNSFSRGIYFIAIRTKGAIFTERFVKE